MLPEVPPTAEGDLARNPFAHLLVFAIERKLTGAMFLTDPSGATHTVRFVRGAPVKVRPGDDYSMLGEMLVDAGHISEEIRDRALDSKGQLGEVLVLAGKLEADVLDKMLAEQFLVRMTHLFALPPKTKYRYFDGHHELVDWGPEPADVDPFKLVWAGISEHGEKSAQMKGTLARLGDAEVRLHERADWRRFGFEDDALDVAELIALEPMPFSELVDLVAEEALIRRVVYTLVMFRQIPMREDLLPVEPLSSPAPKPSATSLGRVHLKTQVHRAGAALDSSGEVVHREYIGSHRRKKSVIAPLDVKKPDADEAPPSTPGAEPVSSEPVSPAPEESGPTSAPTSDEPTPTSAPSATVEGAPTAELEPTSTKRSGDVAAVDARKEAAQGEQMAPPPARPPTSKLDGEVGDSPEEAGQSDEDAELAGLSNAALLKLAESRLESRDFAGAVEAASAAIRSNPHDKQSQVLQIWAKAGSAGADLKTLAVQLDEMLNDDEGLVDARFYRGMIRQKLGDDHGSLSDLKRVLELSPSHERALEAMQAIEARRSNPPTSDSGLWSRLFRR